MPAALLLLLLAILPARSAEILRFTKGFSTVYAIKGERVVLIDANYPGNERWIWRKLAREGIEPGDVSLLVLTHGHGDHAGSAAAIQARGVPVAIGAADAPMALEGYHGEPAPTGLRGRFIKPFLKDHYAAFTPDVQVTDALDLRPYGVDGRAELVAGHTSGSLAVKLDDGSVFIGDLIRGHMVRRRKPTLHFFHADLPGAHAALLGLIDGGATTLYASHPGPLDPARVRRWLERRGAVE